MNVKQLKEQLEQYDDNLLVAINLNNKFNMILLESPGWCLIQARDISTITHACGFDSYGSTEKEYICLY
jgi:hypothetical protein